MIFIDHVLVGGVPQAIISCVENAHELVDKAIATALIESKPVYISVGCNLAGLPHPSFSTKYIPFALPQR